MLQKDETLSGNWFKFSFDLLSMPINSNAKIVFAVMQHYAKENICTLSVTKISKITNLSIRTVNYAIAELKEFEFIESVQVKKGHQVFYYINPIPLK